MTNLDPFDPIHDVKADEFKRLLNAPQGNRLSRSQQTHAVIRSYFLKHEKDLLEFDGKNITFKEALEQIVWYADPQASLRQILPFIVRTYSAFIGIDPPGIVEQGELDSLFHSGTYNPEKHEMAMPSPGNTEEGVKFVAAIFHEMQHAKQIVMVGNLQGEEGLYGINREIALAMAWSIENKFDSYGNEALYTRYTRLAHEQDAHNAGEFTEFFLLERYRTPDPSVPAKSVPRQQVALKPR